MVDVTYSVKFKLDLDPEQKQELETYFQNYKNVVNFAAVSLRKFEKRFVKIPGIKKVGEKFIAPVGFCTSCKEEKELSKVDNSNGGKWCFNCYNKEFGKRFVRKKLYGTRGRKVDSAYSVTNAGKISKTHYNYACRDAVQLLDSLKKLQAKRRENLRRNLQRQKKFEEMLNDPKKRFRVVKPNERKEHFIHISDRDRAETLRPYTLYKLKSIVAVLQRNNARDEHTILKDQPINFKGNRIQLGNSAVVFDFENNAVTMTLFKKKKYRLVLSVSSAKSVDYFKEKIEKIKKQKPKYSYLLRKTDKDDSHSYFIQYTISESIPEKTKYAGVLGIDRGLNHLAVYAFVAPSLKISNVKFVGSKRITGLKVKIRKQKKLLRNKRHREKKIMHLRPVEPRILLYLHEVSRTIVELAKKIDAAIALEHLENVRKKARVRMSDKAKYKLSLFTYKQLGELIKFKAAKEGIKIVEVPAAGTSYRCYRCGSPDTERPYKNTYSLMFCKKEKLEVNADYNAAVNIAKEGLKSLKLIK